MPLTKSNNHPKAFLPDDRQREAIEHNLGPMLVIAGAGTGKTSVLVHSIARFIKEGHAKPEEILALTYTLNSARELLERMRALVGGATVKTFTFHDYFLGLLRESTGDFGVRD